MCTVSMVMDHYWEKWQPRRIEIIPDYAPDYAPVRYRREPMITDEEIREFRDLLERARQYDRDHNQPDCEMTEKRDRIRKLAKELGVEIAFV